MQTCRATGTCCTEHLPGQDGGKNSRPSEVNGRDDRSIKQTSALQVPLKSSGFKSSEKFRKLSNYRFKERIMMSTKQLGLGNDTNVNIFPYIKPVHKPSTRISSACEKNTNNKK